MTLFNVTLICKYLHIYHFLNNFFADLYKKEFQSNSFLYISSSKLFVWIHARATKTLVTTVIFLSNIQKICAKQDYKHKMSKGERKLMLSSTLLVGLGITVFVTVLDPVCLESTIFLLFCRFMPVIAISEVKGVMPEADPHHGHSDQC